jgi:predicted PurR-regulated permease PerM
MLEDFGREISKPVAEEMNALSMTQSPEQAREPVPVEVRQAPVGTFEGLSNVISGLLHPLATTGITFIYAVFILLQREDLRNRVIKLAGTRDLHKTTAALDDAGRRLSRLLLAQLAVNSAFGVIIGMGLWIIGVPSPVLWGILSAILRFIPYVGGLIAAVFPLTLAIAVEPGWSKVILTGLLFIFLDAFAGNVIEPLLYGRSSGLSPFAFVVSATFWTILWGPIGLILTAPMTICLVVTGHHVEGLKFLDVMLGDEPPLSPPEVFYQRMLAGDPAEEVDRAEKLLREQTLLAYYDDIALNGLKLAQNDLTRGSLDPSRIEKIRASIGEFIDELGEHDDRSPLQNGTPGALASSDEGGRAFAPERVAEPPIICVAGSSKLDESAALMLAQLLGKHGLKSKFEGPEALSTLGLTFEKEGAPIVFLSCLDPNSIVHMRYAIRRVHRRLPKIKVFLGCWTAGGDMEDLKELVKADGAGYTAAIIAGDELGATGGPDANAVFLLAVYRASEICIGIVSAGIVLAGTDFGRAQRWLAGSFAALSAEITGRFTNMLALAGPEMPETQPIRRELLRRVIALDPLIDTVIGESSQLHYHSPVLQKAVDGLFAALVGWRIIAVLLPRLPDGEAQQGANAVLRNLPRGLRAAADGVPAEWMADPARLRDTCGIAAQTLAALPAATPPLRLLADQTARILVGLSDALNGLTLLVTDFARSPPGRGGLQIRVPDWLPAVVNAGRAFVVIGIAELFWVVTESPNGALAITFAAISVLLLAPQADRTYALALGFTIGIILAAILTAIIAFAVLPGLETFEAFSLSIGLYLIPTGALMATGVLMAQPRLTVVSSAMILGFVPLLAPENVISYDTKQFYNAALAIVSGSSAAAVSFLLLPPLSPTFRTRRLLALTLRDLRRLAADRVSWTASDWEGHIFGRLAVMPESAEPLQGSQLSAAIAAGNEIIRLRRDASALGFGAGLDAALDAVAQGDSALAAVRLARLDERLAALSGTGPEASLALQARGSILAISDAINDHAAYFDAGEDA